MIDPLLALFMVGMILVIAGAARSWANDSNVGFWTWFGVAMVGVSFVLIIMTDPR